MGECPGDRPYDEPRDDYGSPACSNRDPAPRTRRREPARREQRSQGALLMTSPMVRKPGFHVQIKVETTSGHSFSFETEMPKWELNEIERVAEERAKSECGLRCVEFKSCEITALIPDDHLIPD